MSDAGLSNISSFVFWGVVAAIIIYLIVIYNNLVSLKHNVSKAWSNIDVLLKQRHEELPKLVETCRQYKDFEADTLERVMQARAAAHTARQQGDVPGVGKAESMMRMGLGNLFAVAEAYPELKADQAFQRLQTRITGLENAIADRREFYNESVNINNIRIDQFPDVIVARLLNFREADLLEFSESELADVDVKSLFA